MIRGLWDRETVALMLGLSLLPVALIWLWFGGSAAAGRLGLVLLVSGIWHLVFMLARAQSPSLAGAVSALAVAILAPADLGLFALVLSVSFGTVMGELVFGGWGRNVLNPATVTLAFTGFGFPVTDWPEPALPVIWAAIPALLLGGIFGVISLRLVAGAVAIAGAALGLGLPVGAHLPVAGLVLALLVVDPVASASTRLGAWLNGAVYGALVVLFALGWGPSAPAQIAISAALLAGLSAPLMDEIAIALWAVQRKRRHG